MVCDQVNAKMNVHASMEASDLRRPTDDGEAHDLLVHAQESIK